ncbi:MAG TPA: hypothetical protein VI911_12115 [Patescibacteria group bacterium]|nr:hypothetical protein [Patescibacteria group bacterium]
MKTQKELWDGLEEVFKNKDNPKYWKYMIWDIYLFGQSISIYNSSNGLKIYLCETYPYKTDGEVPLIFIDLWYINMTIDSLFLYKIAYWLKYREWIKD